MNVLRYDCTKERFLMDSSLLCLENSMFDAAEKEEKFEDALKKVKGSDK
jgi:hypothetical protein